MPKHLTAADRGVIEHLLLQENYTLKMIADCLKCHKSTICREVKRSGGRASYSASFSEADYQKKQHRKGAPRKLDKTSCQKYVIAKLKLGWSPEQIAGRMKLENLPDRVCHETIYSWIYRKDEFSNDEIDLYQYLKLARRKRRRRYGRKPHTNKLFYKPSIHSRPDIVEKRIEFGHFEGDSVLYKHKYIISTQNELLTGLIKFTKIKDKSAKNTAIAQSRMLNQYHQDGMATISITYDNGTEFNEYRFIANATGANVYFADPYSSYQRGANENVNGLLRRYLPKGADISSLTQAELDDIAYDLNSRPRKRLGYKTPLEVYHELLSIRKNIKKRKYGCI